MTIKSFSRIAVAIIAILATAAVPHAAHAQKATGWGDFKLFIDPGHSVKENKGLWGYAEAQKTFAVAETIKGYLLANTDMPAGNLMLSRNDETWIVDLEERSDMANAFDADLFYSIHSIDNANGPALDDSYNTTATFFGGWCTDGVPVEKTPHGGKAFGEILNPILTGVMRIPTRGNLYDRCYYESEAATHASQFPYLSVNRRTNMPSLLSESGSCMVASQQRLNINADYKRLEAFAAFKAILQYRGMAVPGTTFLSGIVTNSEDGVPVDGVTVTVAGHTYVTDTWESAFSAYTDDPSLIHNGFYLFEGLESGKPLEVTFAAKGYDSAARTVTLQSPSDGHSADNVTWLDVALTSRVPAVVASVSAAAPGAVSQTEPLVITFSRNMDRESVERAFSLDNGGTARLTWTDDRTLHADLSALTPQRTYTLRIDGGVARNAQTGQLLDGDGDGDEGGDYTLTFTIAVRDLTPARIVDTDPARDGEASNTLRPVVRVVYDKPLAWDDDLYGGCVTVSDKYGNTYPGTLVHSLTGGVSVLHYFFNDDLPLDRCFVVSIRPGLADMSGNLTGAESFRFLSEYRGVVNSYELLPLRDAGGFWAPDASGSTSGITEGACSFSVADIGVDPSDPRSAKLVYDFDSSASTGVWRIREYHSAQNVYGPGSKDGVLTFWLHGDGSNNMAGASLRVRTNGRNGGIKYNLKPVDYLGWHLVSWDLANDAYTHYTGTDELGSEWRLDGFFLKHENTDNVTDPSVPRQAWRGEVYFNDLRFVQFDNNAVRTATIDDITTTGIGHEGRRVPAVTVSVRTDALTVTSDSTVRSVGVFSTDGMLVASAHPGSRKATIAIGHLAKGVYVVKVETDGLTKTVKMAR